MSIKLIFLLSLTYIVLSSILYYVDIKKSHLEITFFDVGQGDSIYIRLPNNTRILIDGGEDYTVSYKLDQKFIFPFCKIDYLIASHAHADHIGGFKKIFQSCIVRMFTFNDIVCNSKLCNYFFNKFKRNSLLKGDLLQIDGVSLKVLWPDLKNDNINYSNINNTSIVIFLDYGEFEALFTGDAELEALGSIDITSILPYIENGLDLYKVSHHGALNGLYKPLLAAVTPKNCIISVGKINKYGHPDPLVLAYLESINCNILRTDELGDITFIF